LLRAAVCVKEKESRRSREQVGGRADGSRVFFQVNVLQIITPRLQRDLSSQPHHTHHTLHPPFWACYTDIGLPYAT
jgi:hypothetical protein